MLGALDIDEASDKSVGQQLKEALRKNAGRVIDLTLTLTLAPTLALALALALTLTLTLTPTLALALTLALTLTPTLTLTPGGRLPPWRLCRPAEEDGQVPGALTLTSYPNP